MHAERKHQPKTKLQYIKFTWQYFGPHGGQRPRCHVGRLARARQATWARPTWARVRLMQTYYKTKQNWAKQLTLFTKGVARGSLAPLPGCMPGRALA